MESSKEFMKKNYWVFLLIIIFLLAFYLRAIPGTKLEYPRLQAIDPYYFFRMGEYIIENGNLPEHDSLAAWGTIPGGPNRQTDFVVTLWAYPMLYFILNPLFGVSWYWVAVWSPAFFGALQVLFTYFLAKELFNSKKIGLLSAIFITAIPGILYRVSAGFIEKEPLAGVFMVLVFYFMVKGFKVIEDEIIKEASWKYLLLHPFSIINRTKIEDSSLMVIKTVIYGSVSGIVLGLMVGVSGIVRVPLVVIALFIMVATLLNRYPKVVFYTYASLLLFYFLVASMFGAIAPPVTSVEVVVNLVALAMVSIRYAIERFRLVKEEYLPYTVPALFLVGLFILGVASYVIVDLGYWLGEAVQRVSTPITLGVIPSTVAESQGAGDFIRNTLSTFGTEYAVNTFQWPNVLVYLSAIYFAAMGIILMCYEFIFKKRNLEYLLIVSFFVSGILLAMGAMRLSFIFAFPVAIAAGYFLIRGGKYFLEVSKKFVKGKGYEYLRIVGGIFIGLVIFTNFASGWLMANGINSSLSNEWYESLIWLRDNTPEGSVILEWWDFGWWFHYIAERPTLVDGGYHNQIPTQDIAKFFTEPLSDNDLNFLKNHTVDYVMVSPDLIQKFGAMSKIANWGAKVDVLPLFNLINNYEEGGKTLLEYSGGGQTILVAYSMVGDGNSTSLQNITALIKTPQGQAYIRDVGIGNQIIRSDRENTIPGMVYFAGNAVIFVPEAVQECVFVRLYLFDGVGMENYFEKVYDNFGMKIYKVRYDNFPETITGEYTYAAYL